MKGYETKRRAKWLRDKPHGSLSNWLFLSEASKKAPFPLTQILGQGKQNMRPRGWILFLDLIMASQNKVANTVNPLSSWQYSDDSEKNDLPSIMCHFCRILCAHSYNDLRHLSMYFLNYSTY